MAQAAQDVAVGLRETGRRRRLSVRTGAVALLIAMLAVGCNAQERIVESAVGAAVGGDVDVDEDGQTMRVTTDEGTVEFAGGTGSLPDDFPEQFPVPDNLEILQSTSMANDGKQFFQLIASTTQDYDDLAPWFEDRLAAQGWDIDGRSQMSMGDLESHTLTLSGHGLSGVLTLHDGEDGPGIQLVLQSEDPQE
jgi:hypothetical protein